MSLTNQQKMQLLYVKINKQVEKSAGKGLNAARVFLTGRVKEALSVPAPRRAVRLAASPGQKRGAISHYVAVTPATVGAAPRKLSSRLRTSTGSKMLDERTAVLGANARANPTKKYPAGFNYPRHLEEHDHPFIAPTVEKYKKEAAKICGRRITLRS